MAFQFLEDGEGYQVVGFKYILGSPLLGGNDPI